MPAETRAAFQERVARDRRLSAITFEARVEPLFERAIAVVAMGGYNTFCEILSFDKPALIVPRTQPRLEQYLRAERASKLGLVRMLATTGGRDPARMAGRLRELPSARDGRACRCASTSWAGSSGWPTSPSPGSLRAAGQPRLPATPDATALPRPHGRHRQGLPAPVGDLHRAGDPGAGAAGAADPHRLAPPSDRSPGPRPAPRHPRTGALSAGIPAGRAVARARRPSPASSRNPRLGTLLRLAARPTAAIPTANRGRRLGQALVLACELPAGVRHLHVHYLHTPGLGRRATPPCCWACPSAPRRMPRTCGPSRTGRSARSSRPRPGP